MSELPFKTVSKSSINSLSLNLYRLVARYNNVKLLFAYRVASLCKQLLSPADFFNLIGVESS